MENNHEEQYPNRRDNATQRVDFGSVQNENHTENGNCGSNGVKPDEGLLGIAINGLEDIAHINLHNLPASIIINYHFPSVAVAFTFYNWYARLNGFSARKSKVRRNKDGDIVQQIFVCYRQGFREDRFRDQKTRQREARTETRCGCEAKCHVCIDEVSGRWYVRCFDDEHNHLTVDEDFIGLLPGHRTMDDDDILQMNSLRKAGIKTSQIYGSFAGKFGGYANVGFLKQDMYNKQDQQRRTNGSDVQVAFSYLRGLKSNDPSFYWSHIVSKSGRLDHLFWSDGRSQLDYSIFDDVLAFDATYNKNKYKCPLVVFSGVNHHNQTIVFASALVSNETEETYVWLLEQFIHVMGGKMPVSVITDGDKAMRSAIRHVLPKVHHRLCAWHLLRNATTNVKNPLFTSLFITRLLNLKENGVICWQNVAWKTTLGL